MRLFKLIFLPVDQVTHILAHISPTTNLTIYTLMPKRYMQTLRLISAKMYGNKNKKRQTSWPPGLIFCPNWQNGLYSPYSVCEVSVYKFSNNEVRKFGLQQIKYPSTNSSIIRQQSNLSVLRWQITFLWKCGCFIPNKFSEIIQEWVFCLFCFQCIFILFKECLPCQERMKTVLKSTDSILFYGDAYFLHILSCFSRVCRWGL